MGQISADLTIELNHTTGKMSSELGLMDVFSSELVRLKRIIAGMGLNASDGEDVLQDVSIRVLKQCRGGSRTVLALQVAQAFQPVLIFRSRRL